MPPLTTFAFVDSDAHKAIVDYIYENTSYYAHDTFVLREFVQKLIAEGRLGGKDRCSLYL